MPHIKPLLESIGLAAIKEAGNEIICICPDCGKNKLSVNKQTGQWQCWVGCGHGNAWTLVEKQTGKPKGEIAQILKEYDLLDPPRSFTRQHTNRRGKKPKLSPDDVVTITQDDIDRLCGAKNIEPAVFGHLQAYKLKGTDIIIIPGFDPDSPEKACGWIRVHLDGELIKVNSGSQKYPVIAGSQPGLIGYKTLPESDTILFCEGWKDFLAARSQGYAALTNTQGVKTWRDSWGQVFQDKTVLMVFDRDKAGQFAEQSIATHISGYAKQVKVARLPYEYQETGGKDLHDYVREDGGKIDDLEFAEFDSAAKNTKKLSGSPVHSANAGQIATSESVQHKSADLLSAEPTLNKKPNLFIADFSKCLEFPIESMPEVLRPLIIEGAEAIQCPPDFIGVPLLTALGGVIGRTHVLEVKPGWLESPALWTVVLGNPGTAKSPALKQALMTVHDLQTKLYEEYSMQKDIYDVDAKVYKKKLKKWERSKSDGEPPIETNKPILRRIIVSDATVEALAPIMNDNPKGLLLVRDELAGWINAMNQYKGGKGADVQFYLTLWSGGSVVVDRKSLSEPINLSNTYLAVTGSCQPEVMIDLLDKERQQDGFASRLLISYPQEVERTWTDEGIDRSIMQPVEQLFIKLCKLEMVNYEDEQGPTIVRFSPAGLEAFIEVMNAHFQQKNKYNLKGPLLAHWAKMEGYTARLSLIIHLIRYVSGEIDNIEVDEVSVLMAAAMGDYFLAHAARLYGMLDADKANSDLERIIKWARKHRLTQISHRDLIASRIVRNKTDSMEHLDLLADAGYGDWKTPDKKVFLIDPLQQLSNSADCVEQEDK